MAHINKSFGIFKLINEDNEIQNIEETGSKKRDLRQFHPILT
jgi:hypothetical protein